MSLFHFRAEEVPVKQNHSLWLKISLHTLKCSEWLWDLSTYQLFMMHCKMTLITSRFLNSTVKSSCGNRMPPLNEAIKHQYTIFALLKLAHSCSVALRKQVSSLYVLDQSGGWEANKRCYPNAFLFSAKNNCLNIKHNSNAPCNYVKFKFSQSNKLYFNWSPPSQRSHITTCVKPVYNSISNVYTTRSMLIVDALASNSIQCYSIWPLKIKLNES